MEEEFCRRCGWAKTIRLFGIVAMLYNKTPEVPIKRIGQ
jgi:hypothetical protein